MRERESETSQAYASLSTSIRLRMKQYNREIYQLKTKVEEASKSRAMYPFDLSLNLLYICYYIFYKEICKYYRYIP